MRSIFFLLFLLFSQTVSFSQYPLETVIQRGHSDLITVLKFSDDGKYLLTGSDDQTLKLWDVKSAREIRTFTGHASKISDADFSVSEKIIISAGSSAAEIKVWDMMTGEEMKTLEGGNSAINMLFDKWEMALNVQKITLEEDGKTLYWAEDNYGIRVGSISKRRYKSSLDTPWEPSALYLEPTDRYLVAGGKAFNQRIDQDGNEIWFYDRDQLELQKELKTTYDDIRFIEGTPDGNRLLCLSTYRDSLKVSNSLQFVDMNSLSIELSFELDGVEVIDVALAPDGESLIVAEKKNLMSQTIMRRYDLTGRLLEELPILDTNIKRIAFSPNGRILVTAGQSLAFLTNKSWDVIHQVDPPDKLDQILFSASPKKLMVRRNRIKDSRFYSFDLNTLDYQSFSTPVATHAELVDFNNQKALVLANQNRIMHFDYRTGQKRNNSLEISSWSSIDDFSIAPSGSVLAVNQNSNKVFFKSSEGVEKLLEGHKRGALVVASDPEGSYFATGGKNNIVKLWDATSGAFINDLTGHNQDISALAFDAEGSILASGSDDTYVRIWDVKNKTRIHSLREHQNNISSFGFQFIHREFDQWYR